MNFFQHQDAARKRTRLLVVLLAAAVAVLILVTVFIVAVGFYMYGEPEKTAEFLYAPTLQFWPYFYSVLVSEVGFWVAAGVVTVVCLGGAYKWLALRAGGRAVAEALGGKLIHTNSTDPLERKVLNVVEEMAIASGNPVPDVYLIDDSCINAFAAGYTRHDAVIGVTKGCLRTLSRDELQGVVAHEFSHIHNGDMRLNMRIIALLHGILLIGLIGHYIVRGSRYRSRRGNDGRAILAGFALMAIGYGGTFFGSLIKAAVSRQREFLADASAVQFTRNPAGIAGALKKIGGHMEGSRLLDPGAETYSHLFFGQSMEPFFLGWLATHPPLAERIKRVEPHWDQQFVSTQPEKVSVYAENYAGANHTAAAPVVAAGGITGGEITGGGIAAATAMALTEQVANPTAASVHRAEALIEGLPAALYNACHEPYLARALIYGLLLDKTESVCESQLVWLQGNAHPATFREMATLWPQVQALPEAEILTLLNLSLPALRRMSPRQSAVFKKNCLQLIQHDNKLDVTEWCLYRLVFAHLDNADAGFQQALAQLKKPLLVLLTALASYGKSAEPLTALNAGLAVLNMSPRTQFPAQLVSLAQLDKAVAQLKNTKPLQKPQLLKAVNTTIKSDGIVTASEQLLMQVVADLLDCPLPADVFASA